jgi:aerobic carbon-monoxide dehydrogenase small subunit
MSRSRIDIHFRVNGKQATVAVDGDESLLEAVERSVGVHGARESCGQGVCGACTMLVNGLAVSSCLYWAVLANGADVSTIEGLGGSGSLHPLQGAFMSEGAFQCGFCTPGMILMAHQLLSEEPHPSPELVRHYLSGSICRCGAYSEIVQAVLVAAESMDGVDG